MSRADRFKKRNQMSINTIQNSPTPDEALVKAFLESSVDENKMKELRKISDRHYDFKYDFNVTEREASDFLTKFKKDFNDERFDKLISDCRNDVIRSIVTPFGLGSVVASYDKHGGNVDTIHNARSDVYATEEAKQSYEEHEEYDSHKYHSHDTYIEVNRKNSQLQEEGKLKDYMTGKTLDRNAGNDLDHVISAKEIDDDAGRVLSGLDGSELANTDINLKASSQTNNRSKKADSMDDFLARKNENLKEMQKLHAKDTLSSQEQNRLRKLEELSKIDDTKAKEADKIARQEYDSKINKEYYTSRKFATSTAVASVNEGAKMGMQQAIGLVITEFFTAVFDEILDIYKNGFSNGFEDDRFFSVLKERLGVIATRVKNKWKEAAVAFADGFIAGFISNLVTTVINMFVTTGKRIVRIIREGLFSLLKAVKMILFPPAGMSYADAMHEAKKLIATGLIISLGVIAEQYIDVLIKGTGILEPFSDVLTSIFVGAITGLTITMVVYYIDKKKNDKAMKEALISDTNKKFDNLDVLLLELRY